MITVRLTPNMTDYADNVGALRRSRAFLNRFKNVNGLTGTFDHLLAIDRLGARCEAAGKVYLNPIHWNACTDRFKGAPDLGRFVDVKGIGRRGLRMPVQKDDPDDFAFLLISAERHPDCDILGWLWGREAKDQRFWDDPHGGRPAYFVPEEWPGGKLREPEELRALIHDAAQEEMTQFAREVLN